MNNIEVKSELVQTSEPEQTKSKYDRQTGFEILRILSMILICAVHIMNFGGMLSNAMGGGTFMATPSLFSIFNFC